MKETTTEKQLGLLNGQNSERNFAVRRCLCEVKTRSRLGCQVLLNTSYVVMTLPVLYVRNKIYQINPHMFISVVVQRIQNGKFPHPKVSKTV